MQPQPGIVHICRNFRSMKRTLIPVALILFFACNKTPQADIRQVASSAESEKQTADQSTAQYHNLTGSLGGTPVHMHLVATPAAGALKESEKVSLFGAYYYERIQHPLSLGGDFNPANDSMTVRFYSRQDNQDEIFEGTWKDRTFSGTWKKQGKSLPFSLVAATESGTDLIVRVYEDSLAGKNKFSGEKGVARYFQQWLEPAANPENAVSTALKSEISSLIVGARMADTQNYSDLTALKDSFFHDFQTYVLDDSSIMMMDYVDETRMEVVYNQSNWLTLRATGYSYTGGAHGNYYATVTAFDLKTGKRLTYNDLFKPGYEIPLLQALEKKIRKEFNLAANKPLSEALFEDELDLPERFGVTGKGILYHYSPYEIAAYAYGDFEIFIPFSELSSVLKPGLSGLQL